MIELHGMIDEEGNAHIFNRYQLVEWFKQHKNGKFTLVVDKKKKKRSTRQNAYYWDQVVPMVKDGFYDMGTEMSISDTHEFLKKQFNYKEVLNEKTGELITVPQSTTELSTTEFSIYKEKIQRFAAEFLGIYIPDPNEALTIDYKEE